MKGSILGLLVQICGCVALLLWGTHMVGSGVMRVFGSGLRHRVAAAMAKPLSAFGTGLFVTLGLQSSTATGFMASSFVARGVLGAEPGYVLMLGANVGTALVAQILSLPISPLAPLLMVVGWAVFRASAGIRRRNVGRIFMGLGMMLFGLHEMLAVSQGAMGTQADWHAAGQVVASQPGMVLVACICLAWACHSSVAIVLLALSLSLAGVLPLQAGWMAILGANLGGAIPPVVEAASIAERRLPLGNLIVRSAGVAIGVSLSSLVVAVLSWRNSPHDLVWMHLLFNVVLAIIAFPFAKLVTKLVFNIAPDPPTPEDPGHPLHLVAGNDPILAISSAEREALRVADLVKQMFTDCGKAVVGGDMDAASRVRAASDAATALGASIRGFLVGADSSSWKPEEKERSQEILVFVINLEHAVDIAEHQLLLPVLDRYHEQGKFAPAQEDALAAMMKDLDHALDLAVAVFLRHDLRAARLLVQQKTKGRAQENEWMRTRPLVGRWSQDIDADLRAMREARRIYGHLAAIAYEFLDRSGQLRSRISES